MKEQYWIWRIGDRKEYALAPGAGTTDRKKDAYRHASREDAMSSEWRNEHWKLIKIVPKGSKLSCDLEEANRTIEHLRREIAASYAALGKSHRDYSKLLLESPEPMLIAALQISLENAEKELERQKGICNAQRDLIKTLETRLRVYGQ